MARMNVMPLFTDALLADCAHLSAEEFGAYLRLLIVHWRMLPDRHLPDDDKQLARYAGLSDRRWKAVRAVVVSGSMYRSEDGYLRQKKLENVHTEQRKKSDALRQNGKRGGRPKAMKSNETTKPNGFGLLSPSFPSAKADEKASMNHEPIAPKSPETENQKPLDLADLTDRCLAAAGLDPNSPTAQTGSWRIVQGWLRAGADPERDILPTLARIAERRIGDPPRSLKYFSEAVTEAAAENAHRPAGEAARIEAERKAALAELYERYGDTAKAVRAWVVDCKNGADPDSAWRSIRGAHGPRPDRPDTRIPAEVRAFFEITEADTEGVAA